jgi:hypothetical protein
MVPGQGYLGRAGLTGIIGEQWGQSQVSPHELLARSLENHLEMSLCDWMPTVCESLHFSGFNVDQMIFKAP